MKELQQMFTDITDKIIDVEGNTVSLTEMWKQHQIEKCGAISTPEVEIFRDCVEMAFIYIREWLAEYIKKEETLL